MAEVNLRTYSKEIDSLIEEGQQVEEAIAHCRHILKTYPKHIETYRLLGKAYLESKRYGDAADIFQRVLSAMPDDLVSHAGMAIIREDEGNLDASIWHMERASEVKPGNVAIEQELKRLIGRRDGLEPQRARPTRGALARMYYNGELYPYAVNELRLALEEDEDRPDLQILLAKTFWYTDQRLEAANLCNQIIEKLPYCYDANRITATLLQASGKSEEATINLRRLIALDPYIAFTDNPMDDPNQVEVSAIQIEKYAWTQGRALPSSEAEQPDWAASLGVNLKGDTGASAEEKEMPAWLKYSESTETQEPAEQETPVSVHPFAGAKPPPGVDIPEWMKEVGWQEGTGEAIEGPIDFSSELEEPSFTTGSSDEPLTPARIPNWLSEISPRDQIPQEEAKISLSPISKGDQGESEQVFPDWIGDLGFEAGETIDEDEAFAEDQRPFTGATQEPAQEDVSEISQELPPWLEPSIPGATDTIVSWLGNKSFEKPPSLPEDVPPWMRGTGPLQEIMPEEAKIPSAEKGWEQFDEIPKPSEEPIIKSPFDEIAFETVKAEEEGLRSEAEELFPSEIASTKSTPDWLEAISEVEGEKIESKGITPDEAPDWLEQYETPSEEPTATAQPYITPEWLTEIEEEEFEPAIEESIKEEEPPEWLKEVITEDIPQVEAEQVFEGEKKPDWLEGLAEADMVEGKTPSEETEAPPGWIAELSYGESEQAPAETPQEEEPPDWIRVLAETEIKAEPEATLDAESPPDWVTGVSLPQLEEGVKAPGIEEEPPSWLQQLGPVPIEAEAIPEETPFKIPLATVSEELEAETSEWLSDIQEPSPIYEEEISRRMQVFGGEKSKEDISTLKAPEIGKAEAPPPALSESPLPADQAPDWLQDIAFTEAETPETPIKEGPDWLTEIEVTEQEPTLVSQRKTPEEVLFGSTDVVPEPDREERVRQEEAVWELEFETPEIIPEDVGEITEADFQSRLMWLQETAQEVTAEPEIIKEQPEAVQHVTSLEELVPSMESPMEDEEVFSFLEDLAASQVTDEGEIALPPIEAVPEQLTEAIIEEEQPLAGTQAYPEELDESLMWLEQLAVDEKGESPVSFTGTNADEDLFPAEMPDWLEEVAERQGKPIEQIKGGEKIEQQLGEPEWPPMLEFPTEEKLPDEQVRTTAEIEEDFLVEEDIPAIPSVRKKWAPPSSEVTQPEMKTPTEEAQPLARETPDREGEWEIRKHLGAAPASRPTAPKETTALPVKAPLPSKPAERKLSPLEILDLARVAFEKGNVEQALDQYSKLIDRGAELETIITDLTTAIDRTPNAPLLWQVLGDAYMKKGEISEAIEAYRHGMEAL